MAHKLSRSSRIDRIESWHYGSIFLQDVTLTFVLGGRLLRVGWYILTYEIIYFISYKSENYQKRAVTHLMTQDS